MGGGSAARSAGNAGTGGRAAAPQRIRVRPAFWTGAGSFPAVYLAPDDAKTDVILAAAVVVLGPLLRAFTGTIGPPGGVIALIVDLLWIVALSALVPVALARYRGDGADAFAIHGIREAFGPGLLLALPAIGVGLVIVATVGGGVGLGPLGRLSATDPIGLLVGLVQVTLLTLGAWLLIAFLAVRSREGFPRSPEMPLTQLVRTAGLILTGVAVVGGLLRGVTGGSLAISLASALAVGLIVLLTDQMIPSGITVPRAAIIAPLVIVVVGNVYAAGGIFRGLLAGLSAASLAGGVTLAIAAMALTRRGIGITLPLVLAVHLWPTCLSPLTIAGGVC
jgi:hypothetical protein